MLAGFATVASGGGGGGGDARQYVRPVLTEVRWVHVYTRTQQSCGQLRVPSLWLSSGLAAPYRQAACRPAGPAPQAGPIALVEARHPVLECLEAAPFQPNDTYLALSSSFHIITGGCSFAGGL